jgi:hypothetical protein
MSLELNLYSFRTKVAALSELEPHLDEWRVCLVNAQNHRVLPRARRIPTNSLALGWIPKPGLPDVDALVSKWDEPGLNKLARRGRLGSCALSITSNYTPEAEELEDLARFTSQEALALLRTTKVLYNTHTSAGRNARSVELQALLCISIGLATSGLFEDPQEGSFRLIRATTT